MIFREIQEMSGLCTGGTNINNQRYANDTVLLAEKSSGPAKNHGSETWTINIAGVYWR